jgi:hypothetical protein
MTHNRKHESFPLSRITLLDIHILWRKPRRWISRAGKGKIIEQNWSVPISRHYTSPLSSLSSWKEGWTLYGEDGTFPAGERECTVQDWNIRSPHTHQPRTSTDVTKRVIGRGRSMEGGCTD